MWQRPRASMSLKGIEFPTMRVLIETTNMYVAHQIERTFGRIDSSVIHTTRSSYADIVSKLKYKCRDKDYDDAVAHVRPYSSSDDEADGTIDITTFSKTSQNFNVYVLDNPEAVYDLVETHNRIRKNVALYEGQGTMNGLDHQTLASSN